MKQEIRLPKGYELKELEEGVYEIVKSEFKLEVGKDYRSTRDSGRFVLDRKGTHDNYAIFNSGFTDAQICVVHEHWQEATETEVIKAFEKELIRRFGENWRNVKVKECIYSADIDSINKGWYDVSIAKDQDGWNVWSKNGCLFNGKEWAEAIEEHPIIELRGLDKRWKYCSKDIDNRVYFYDVIVEVDDENDGQWTSTKRPWDYASTECLDQSTFKRILDLPWTESLHKIKHV